ncbi:MAG: flagellar hook-basal body complex protein FliE [Myxococcota bacterium]
MDQVLIDRLREPGVLGGAAGLPGQATPPSGGGRFAEIVADLVSDVNAKQVEAESNAAGLARGEVDMMDAVVSLNEADLSLRMMMQIRDRALEAYRTILQSI